MRTGLVVPFLLAAVVLPPPAAAQRKFPPDSLLNVKVFDAATPITTVIGTMRNFTSWLGVRCQYCHVGEEALPLEQFDFASDEKRTKKTARLMMAMVRDINSRLMDVPQRPEPSVEVTCQTCHRGVPRPVPLLDLLGQAHAAGGVDSASTVYRNLHGRYFGSAAYDFGENTLNTFAGRLQRARQFADALAVVELNAEFHAGRPSVPFTRGEVLLARGDTAAAIQEYQAASRLGASPGAVERLRMLRSLP